MKKRFKTTQQNFILEINEWLFYYNIKKYPYNYLYYMLYLSNYFKNCTFLLVDTTIVSNIMFDLMKYI